ncbi:alcohol dehydrogenase 1-like [Neosynchiropus ocellatus]
MDSDRKVIRCKAAVSWGPRSPMVMEEIEVAAPQAGEVRIKVVATGVCRTDLYYLAENDSGNTYPIVLGHEASGIVESVGPGVTKVKPGDKVIPLLVSQCRECRFCISPKTNICEKSWDLNPKRKRDSRFFCRGKPLKQFMGLGTFSEYTVVNEIALAKIDQAAPLEKVCLIGCCICTGFGAAVNNAKVEPGSTCAVFGLGAVGLAAVMGCKAAGAKRIIAVDINPEKFETAKMLGATDFVNPNDHKKPIDRVIAAMTNGGVDYSLECVGNVELMNSALKSCMPGWGVSVIVGWTEKPMNKPLPMDLISGRTWKGSIFGGFKGEDGVSQMVDAYMDKQVKLDEFITHNMTLAEINQAIDLLKEGKSIRTVLNMSAL